MLDLTSATLSMTSHPYLDFAHATQPRSRQWARHFVQRDDQAHLIRAALGSPQAALAFSFNKAGPAAGLPNFNEWSLDFPSGTDGNIAITRVVDDSMSMQLLCADADGNEIKSQVFQGALASASVNVDPGDVYALRFWAFNPVVASSLDYPATGTLSANYDSDPTKNGQQFTSDESVRISGVRVWLSGSGSGTCNTTAYIYSNGASNVPSLQLAASAAVVVASASSPAVEYTFLFATPYEIRPDVIYYLCFASSTAIGSTWATGGWGGGLFARHGSANSASLGYPLQMFGAMGAGADELARLTAGIYADDDDSAQVTAITVPLLATGVPYTNLMAEQSAYWLNGVLTNTSTGQSVTLDIICALADVIEVDCGARTVRNTTTDENVLYGGRFSDPDEWITLPPGDSSFSYSETGVVNVDVNVYSYDRWS